MRTLTNVRAAVAQPTGPVVEAPQKTRPPSHLGEVSSDELVICIKCISSIRTYEGLLDLFCIRFLLRAKLPVYG